MIFLIWVITTAATVIHYLVEQLCALFPVLYPGDLWTSVHLFSAGVCNAWPYRIIEIGLSSNHIIQIDIEIYLHEKYPGFDYYSIIIHIIMTIYYDLSFKHLLLF